MSAAAYSLVAFIYAISSIIPAASTFPSTVGEIPNVYLHAFMYQIFMITAGMAPTIMVARFAFESSKAFDRPTAVHMSELEIQEPIADVNVTQIPVPGGVVHGR